MSEEICCFCGEMETPWVFDEVRNAHICQDCAARSVLQSSIPLPRRHGENKKFHANYNVEKDDLFFEVYNSKDINEFYRWYIKDLIYYLKVSGYFKPIAREFIKAYEENEK